MEYIIILEVIRDYEFIHVKVLIAKDDIQGHPKGVDVHSKLTNLGRP